VTIEASFTRPPWNLFEALSGLTAGLTVALEDVVAPRFAGPANKAPSEAA
jgi:hypothetical protein